MTQSALKSEQTTMNCEQWWWRRKKSAKNESAPESSERISVRIAKSKRDVQYTLQHPNSFLKESCNWIYLFLWRKIKGSPTFQLFFKLIPKLIITLISLFFFQSKCKRFSSEFVFFIVYFRKNIGRRSPVVKILGLCRFGDPNRRSFENEGLKSQLKN